jgi:TonB-dependent SusC/RagA subfamily outer membrane receptor
MTRRTLRPRGAPDSSRRIQPTNNLRRRLRVALLAGLVGPASLACATRQASRAPAPVRAAERATVGDGVLTSRDVDRQHVSRIEELIRGRVAGVEVIPLANGDYTLRIRGTHSIYGSNEPLIVLDGMPLSGSVRDALRSINPADVARVEVLKDAASTSWYGSRGANGVIVITSKRRN